MLNQNKKYKIATVKIFNPSLSSTGYLLSDFPLEKKNIIGLLNANNVIIKKKIIVGK